MGNFLKKFKITFISAPLKNFKRYYETEEACGILISFRRKKKLCHLLIPLMPLNLDLNAEVAHTQKSYFYSQTLKVAASQL